MISKELLSAVFNIDVVRIVEDKHRRTICVYERDSKYPCSYNASAYIEINIHELAHKCKEWAFKKGYFVQSDFLEVNIYPIEYDGFKMKLVQCFDIVPIDCDSYTEEEIDSFPHNETEAIFKACEWILKEKQ